MKKKKFLGPVIGLAVALVIGVSSNAYVCCNSGSNGPTRYWDQVSPINRSVYEWFGQGCTGGRHSNSTTYGVISPSVGYYTFSFKEGSRVLASGTRNSSYTLTASAPRASKSIYVGAKHYQERSNGSLKLYNSVY